MQRTGVGHSTQPSIFDLRPQAKRRGNAILTSLEKSTILRSVSLFAQTPDDILVEVADRLEEIALQAGETIFEQGDAGDALYIIVEGRVRVHGGGRTLTIMEPHGIFALRFPDHPLTALYKEVALKLVD